MRIPRIHTSVILQSGISVALGKNTTRYIVSVLRLKVGQSITLFNGEGGEYNSEISSIGKNEISVLVGQFLSIDRESPLKIHLVIGISRGDRMDWIIQKAIELGVSQISPVFADRTEVKLHGNRLEKKIAHWQQIAISTCEQCQRNVVPTINPALALSRWLDCSQSGLKILTHHLNGQSLQSLNPKDSEIILLVGPEGGLSADELSLCKQNGYESVSLGPRVLRTETAPLAAISIMQTLWGDMG